MKISCCCQFKMKQTIASEIDPIERQKRGLTSKDIVVGGEGRFH